MKAIRRLGLAWLTLILTAPLSASAQGNPVTLTFDPIMVKGPTTARVTIVEFSDYQ